MSADLDSQIAILSSLIAASRERQEQAEQRRTLTKCHNGLARQEDGKVLSSTKPAFTSFPDNLAHNPDTPPLLAATKN